MKKSKDYDKYYTKIEIAEDCYSAMKTSLANLQILPNNLIFIEPSAGSGVFLKVVKENIKGFDLVPEGENIIQNDFLSDKNLLDYLTAEEKKSEIIIIGNPPFGKKSDLAIKFVNKSFEYSDIVGFIVPIQFRKWSVQKHIARKAKLILDKDLPENSFTLNDKDYKVRCCFQIWTLKNIDTDLRIIKKPKTSHHDFKMYQYNATLQAEKYFSYDWDFAVPRQGYNDYSLKVFKNQEIDRGKQWIFFKAKNQEVLERLLKIDFVKLSKKNIGIPGFGKADVLEEYTEKFSDVIEPEIKLDKLFDFN